MDPEKLMQMLQYIIDETEEGSVFAPYIIKMFYTNSLFLFEVLSELQLAMDKKEIKIEPEEKEKINKILNLIKGRINKILQDIFLDMTDIIKRNSLDSNIEEIDYRDNKIDFNDDDDEEELTEKEKKKIFNLLNPNNFK